MLQKYRTQAMFFSLFYAVLTHASPWFTGPILAPNGNTIPFGHANVEIYGFATSNVGVFNRHWKLATTPAAESYQVNPIISYGLADKFDAQLNLPYADNKSQHRQNDHIGDIAIALGYQALTQQPKEWLPNLRITLQQIFPTGRYEFLDPTQNGVDATGTGTYQTALGFNFQDLSEPFTDHYLRTRLSLVYQYANPVTLHGLSTHGGTQTTHGTYNYGNVASADVACEFTLTQHWVPVIEAFYFHRDTSSFTGTIDLDGVLTTLGHQDVEEFSLAPALEYNFSENYGIIAGAWFVIKGKDAPDFISTIIAFNAFF